MSKANDKALHLFQKSARPTTFSEGFEERELISKSSFRAEFISSPLSEEEHLAIQDMLESSMLEGELSSKEVEEDHQRLAVITTEIRAIEKQSVLLHGERIHKAQQIFKHYKDGTFTRWLQFAYGNRQTPYRMLQFYGLFKELEKEERELINAMPKRAAYALASRNGELEKKIAIIKTHHASSPEEIIKVVQNTFPLQATDRRKNSRRINEVDLLRAIFSNIKRLKERKSLEGVLALVEAMLATPSGEEVDPNQIDMFES